MGSISLLDTFGSVFPIIPHKKLWKWH